MQGCCIEYIILEGDNLASLFPNAYLNLGGIELNPQTLFAVIAALAVLPTVWLRDLSVLSYISGNTYFYPSNDLIFRWVLLTFTMFFYSWWSYCISFSGSVLVMDWHRRCRLSTLRDNTESWNSSCCYWSLWLLLFWTCCVPKYLHINGKTKPIPCSTSSMVHQRSIWAIVYSSEWMTLDFQYISFLIFFWRLILFLNLSNTMYDFLLSLVVLEFVPCYMLVVLLWDTKCLEKIHSLNSPLTCLKTWLQPRLLSGLRYTDSTFNCRYFLGRLYYGI